MCHQGRRLVNGLRFLRKRSIWNEKTLGALRNLTLSDASGIRWEKLIWTWSSLDTFSLKMRCGSSTSIASVFRRQHGPFAVLFGDPVDRSSITGDDKRDRVRSTFANKNETGRSTPLPDARGCARRQFHHCVTRCCDSQLRLGLIWLSTRALLFFPSIIFPALHFFSARPRERDNMQKATVPRTRSASRAVIWKRERTINIARFFVLPFRIDHADLRSRYNRRSFRHCDRYGQRIRNHPRPHYVRECVAETSRRASRSCPTVLQQQLFSNSSRFKWLDITSDSFRNENDYRLQTISHDGFIDPADQ